MPWHSFRAAVSTPLSPEETRSLVWQSHGRRRRRRTRMSVSGVDVWRPSLGSISEDYVIMGGSESIRKVKLRSGSTVHDLKLNRNRIHDHDFPYSRRTSMPELTLSFYAIPFMF